MRTKPSSLHNAAVYLQRDKRSALSPELSQQIRLIDERRRSELNVALLFSVWRKIWSYGVRARHFDTFT